MKSRQSERSRALRRDVRVGEFGIGISLYQIPAGTEDLSGRRDSRSYKIFGKHDVLQLTPFVDANDIFSGYYMPGMRHMNTQLCFAWHGHSEPLESRFFDHSAIGIMVIKFKDALAADYGITLDAAFCSYLKNEISPRDPVVEYSPMGSLGWNEITLLLSSEDIAAILDRVLALRRLTVGALLGTDSKAPALLTSFTLPCVSYAAIKEHHTRGFEASELIGDLSPRILVSCAPGYEFNVAEQGIKRFFPDDTYTLRCVFGKGDIEVEAVQSVEASRFLSSLMNFRRWAHDHMAHLVYSTETSLAGPVPHGDWPIPSSSDIDEDERPTTALPLPPSLGYRDSTVFKPELYAHIERMHSLFYSTQNNPLLRGAFADMREFVEAVTMDTEQELVRMRLDGPALVPHQPPSFSLTKISHAIEHFEYGFRERAVGTYEAMYGAMDPPKAYPGGVQRVLGAASSIPLSMTSKVGTKWCGFVMFGRGSMCYRGSFGVMNLPWDYLFAPGSWWQLSHEAGHDVLEQGAGSWSESLERRAAAVARRAVTDNMMLSGGEEKIVDALIEQIGEIAVDLFEFVFGFDADWLGFSRTVWTFLHDRLLAMMEESPDRYLLRHLFIWLFREDGLMGEVTAERALVGIRELVSGLVESGLLDAVDDGRLERIATKAVSLSEFRDVMRDAIRVADAKGTTGGKLSTSATRELEKGIVLELSVDDLDGPRKIALYCASGGESAALRAVFRLRIGAILSLWDWYVRRRGWARSREI